MLRVPHNEVSFHEDGSYYYRGQPFTGTAYAAYPDGSPESETQYRHGLVWGLSKSWHVNGALASEAECCLDVQHGWAREWSQSGRLESESKAEYGILIEERAWDEKGNLIKEYRLREGDPNHGRLLKLRVLYAGECEG
jgi:antitoxin component YwqK of YwqJK toxin-antitoxin module